MITKQVTASLIGLIVSSSAWAGISMYNPQTGETESLGSISGMQTPAPAVQQAPAQKATKPKPEAQKNRYKLTPQATNLVMDKVKAAPPKEEKLQKEPYGEILAFIQVGQVVDIEKFDALSTILKIEGVNAELYHRDMTPEQQEKLFERDSKLAEQQMSAVGRSKSPDELERMADRIATMPDSQVDTNNSLSQRYSIRYYPMVIYTEPSGRVTKYDLSTKANPYAIAEKIANHIKQVKRANR